MRHLAALYDAIEDGDAFAALPATVAAASRARSAIIHHFEPGGQQHMLLMSYFDPEHARLYATSFVDKDPWLRHSQAGLVDQVVNMDRHLPPAEFTRTEMYNDLFRARGDDTARCMGAIMRIGSSLLVTAVHRPLRGRPFAEAEERTLRAVLEHVRRIVRVRSLAAAKDAEIGRLENMLDATDAAVIVVDEQMRVRRASTAAARVLDARDGLSMVQGRLSVFDMALADPLRRAISDTIHRTGPAKSAFLCARPSERPGLRLLVLPAGADGADGALVVIDVPRDRARAADRSAMLAQAYRLTPAEAALAAGLCSGLTLAEIADQRGVTLETIKTQLKSTFAKTGSNRQAELVRLFG